MLIKMLQSRLGTEDGRVVYLYPSGRELEVADVLARHFIRMGWAELITDKENENADR